MKTITEIMRKRLVTQGMTATTSKKSATLLVRWADEQGMKVSTFTNRNTTFVELDEEDEETVKAMERLEEVLI